MEKIDVLDEYLQLRFQHHGVAMEGLSTIYHDTLAKLRAWLRSTGGGAIQRLQRAPWQEESFRRFILNDLTDPKNKDLLMFNNKWSAITGNDAGWFTIGNRAIASQSGKSLLSTWVAEAEEYSALIKTHRTVCLKYLDWAVNATQSILLAGHRDTSVDYDLLMKEKPPTVAEGLLADQFFWIGTPKSQSLAVSKKFGQQMLTIIDIPVKPPKMGDVAVPGIGLGEGEAYAKAYQAYDELVSLLNDVFEQMDRRVARLKTYREIAKVDEAYHPILTAIDQEMMLYFNVELFASMYSRAGSIQASIAHYIHQNLLPQ